MLLGRGRGVGSACSAAVVALCKQHIARAFVGQLCECDSGAVRLQGPGTCRAAQHICLAYTALQRLPECVVVQVFIQVVIGPATMVQSCL